MAEAADVRAADTKAADVRAADMKGLGLTRFMGVDRKDSPPGSRELILAPESRHLNHNGDVAGPVLFTLAEFAGMGAAVNGLMDVFDRLYVVARDGRISYTARAKAAAGPFTASALVEPARHAACRAAALAGERIELEVPVRITDAQGTLCAEAVFTAVVRPRR